MLTLERIKELLEQPHMPDIEAEEIRKGIYDLAKIIFDKWQIDRKKALEHSNTEVFNAEIN